MKYTSICKALFDYTPQTNEEISFKEDDILYIVENEDPDWWKAQLKTTSFDQMGPIGLVPSNYIDEAEPIGTVKALFDYQAQQEEELSFHEEEILVLYENDDPDWFLVKSRDGHIGLAPSNYIETLSSDQESKANSAEYQPAVSVFSALSNADSSYTLNTKDEAISWSVHEYDVDKKKKKKSKGSLLAGNGMFCYGSETDKTSPVRQFSILDITDYGQDGKNIHVELGGSANSVFDFQASSKSEAKAILSKLDDSRSIANRLRIATTTTIQPEPRSPEPPVSVPTIVEPEQPLCEPRWAIVLYDFDAQGDDELTVKEQEQVLILDYVSSDEWWTVEHQDGRSGIVPTTYVKFQEDYEADLAKVDAENETRRQQEEVEQQQQQQQQREAEASAARQRRLDEEEERQKKEQQKQQDQLEKERVRQLEAERRRRMQDEANQRELDAKRAAARAAAAANSPQISAAVTASPRRSQIPAPLPPTAKTSAAKSLPTDQAVKSISVPTSRSLPERPKQAHDNGKPDPAKVRTWTDRTGAFKVEAQFVSYNNGKIRLHKINGVKIDVPLQKMCKEDLYYVEQETGTRLLEDKSDDIPLAQLKNKNDSTDSGFTWFDYFTTINIPSKSALQYAAAFQQDGLGENDIDNLTHRKMKSMGMTEKHVQRLQRYLETQVAEPLSGDEDAGIGSDKNGKKYVTFGSTSVIHEDDDNDGSATDGTTLTDRQRQIEEDERFARQLQLQENDTTRTSLQRRGTGRPTPNTSAPKDMNAQIMDKIKNQLGSQPLIPSPISPSKPATLIQSSAPSAPTISSTGFQDDAWANRQSTPVATNTTTVNQSSVPGANSLNNRNTLIPTAAPSGTPLQSSSMQLLNPSPQPVYAPVQQTSQQPISLLSQTNHVNPQLLTQWTNNGRTSSPQQQQQQQQTIQQSFSQIPPASNITQNKPYLSPGSPNMFMNQQQQQSHQQFSPQYSHIQQQQYLQPSMQSQSIAMNTPISSVQHPPLVPTRSPMSTLQPQATGRNWTSATPDNPFGNTPQQQSPQPAAMDARLYPSQTSPANFNNLSLQPSQVFASMTGSQIQQPQQQYPNDPYSVLKNTNPQGPGVFNPQTMPFQPTQQTGFIPQQQTGFMPQQQTGFGTVQPQSQHQQSFYNNGGW